MGVLDDAMASVAKTLTDTFVEQESVVYRSGDSNSFTSGQTQGPDVPYNVRMAPPSPFKQGEVNGASIKNGDMRVIVPRLNIPAAMGEFQQGSDRIAFPDKPTERWRVVGVDPIKSGDQVAAYELHLRK